MSIRPFNSAPPAPTEGSPSAISPLASPALRPNISHLVPDSSISPILPLTSPSIPFTLGGGPDLSHFVPQSPSYPNNSGSNRPIAANPRSALEDPVLEEIRNELKNWEKEVLDCPEELSNREHISKLIQNCYIHKVHTLALKGWNISSLPQCIRKLSHLKNLRVDGCENVTRINWQDLPPSIRRIQITHCAKLETIDLPNLPASLEELTIQFCSRLYQITLSQSIANAAPKSGALCIHECAQLASLDLSQIEGPLVFETLMVAKCPLFQHLTAGTALNQIEQMHLRDCSLLEDPECLAELPLHSLKILDITGCANITFLPFELAECLNPLTIIATGSNISQDACGAFVQHCRTVRLPEMGRITMIHRDSDAVPKERSLRCTQYIWKRHFRSCLLNPQPMQLNGWTFEQKELAHRFLLLCEETQDFDASNRIHEKLIRLIYRSCIDAPLELRDNVCDLMQDAVAACSDRTGLVLNRMAVLHRLHHASHLDSSELASLLIGYKRLQLLSNKGLHLAEETGFAGEEVEVLLYLETKLKDSLKLPLATSEMIYSEFVERIHGREQEIRAEILRKTTRIEDLISALTNPIKVLERGQTPQNSNELLPNNPWIFSIDTLWIQHLEKLHPESFNQLQTDYETALDKAEQEDQGDEATAELTVAWANGKAKLARQLSRPILVDWLGDEE